MGTAHASALLQYYNPGAVILHLQNFAQCREAISGVSWTLLVISGAPLLYILEQFALQIVRLHFHTNASLGRATGECLLLGESLCRVGDARYLGDERLRQVRMVRLQLRGRRLGRRSDIVRQNRRRCRRYRPPIDPQGQEAH